MASNLALQPQAVSAPGKVFVAGGYLVLDRKYTALVFGLDARIHVEIEPIRTKSGVTLSEIIVRSPQFREAAWEYGYRLTEGDGGIAVTQLRAPIAPSSISILADQAYYSNPGTPLSPSSRFLKFDVALSDAHKTGLGSSAALVTAFTAAVLSYYLSKDEFDLEKEEGKRVLHNLSQASHCAAQGKVGSGFDIASAVYGSCLYRRFSPSLLSSLPAPGAASFAQKLRALVEGDTWDVEIAKAKVKMPRGLRLVMCDVDCGSQTPGMVKKVLKWREENPQEADRIWGSCRGGMRGGGGAYAVGDGGDGDYKKLKDIIASNRALIREMSKASDVPIEPPQQTQLLDACSAVPGVVGGVVPGAGGYDAIVLLLEDKEEVIGELRKVVEIWKVDGEGDGGVTIGKVGILGVREDMVGVRREDVEIYREWITETS
ncbi:phosphomevalonate kinase [Didymosphaeria variabile]|uniref:Phosphomevalonate kinase n=1 Tax=Didymosphaeria variabile TaxID=1932322 RepID=A0A9W9CBB6_9PLEO|nr:phosphomevalonate kinase [Didymosphaeria variabile]KAJ4354606.1 phosphomevalonate kinase [Didymosphaeria variabile]